MTPINRLNMNKISVITVLILSLWTLASCSNKKEQVSEASSVPRDPLLYGKDIAVASGGILVGHLLKAIDKDGTVGAIDFCNISAFALTDSLSRIHQVGIRRVSDRYRNPLNAANDTEIGIINEIKSQIADGNQPKSKAIAEGAHTTAYYPILVNGMCLQCHGHKDRDIDQLTSTAIRDRYPDDRAHGYVVGDLRGLWVVTMISE